MQDDARPQQQGRTAGPMPQAPPEPATLFEGGIRARPAGHWYHAYCHESAPQVSLRIWRGASALAAAQRNLRGLQAARVLAPAWGPDADADLLGPLSALVAAVTDDGRRWLVTEMDAMLGPRPTHEEFRDAMEPEEWRGLEAAWTALLGGPGDDE